MSSSDSSHAVRPPLDAQALDALTGGAFTAPTSGERASRIRAWLAGEPSVEQMSEVFKQLSQRDKGAARPVRERLDELRRARDQESVAAEWAQRAEQLLSQPRLNLADALAWQRDAAKAGAPLSREPLAGLKGQLAERVRVIEDLQHRAQVQREAAVLIAQRTEVLSTKSWTDAQAAWDGLRTDIDSWQAQAEALKLDAAWPSVDPRFAPQLDAARTQLLAVWEAFEAALRQAVAAAADASAPLPAVPVWADELRALRGEPADEKPARAKPDAAAQAQHRAAAQQAVSAALAVLNKELAEGHGKSTPKAAADLRQALKEHARHLEGSLEAQAHAALAAAGELEGWQRWRADQIREELIARARALVAQPQAGRKQQEALRSLREQWKAGDQGGVPNHALWKRFDEACNEAHKVVEAWLEKTREQQEASRAQRRGLMDELRAWTEAHQADTDWKQRIRTLHTFEQRWREGGHLSEKAFAEMNAQWKPLLVAAEAPLAAVREQSLARRRAMIDEAQALGAQDGLRIDAIKALQQRWQQEAQAVPLERRQEQKLWDAFRKPIDDAFQRKSAERERAVQALGEHDRRVLAAAKALEEANASGDARRIQTAARALEDAVRGRQEADAQTQDPQAGQGHPSGATVSGAPVAEATAAAEGAAPAPEASAVEGLPDASGSPEGAARSTEGAADGSEDAVPAALAAPVKAAPRPVVAMRGDDRPGAKRPEAAPARGGRDARPAGRAGRPEGREGHRTGDRRGEGFGDRMRDRPADRMGDRARGGADRGPRLGDAAFRAQREALEHAQQALRKLAAQAHGEVLAQLMSAWQQRDPAQVPAAQALGKAVSAALRSQWAQALSTPASGASDAAEPLLRLEIAADLPTPAEHLSERRMLQLQLLTRRNAPSPAQTWGEDLARVLATPHEPSQARRVQNVLKVLLRG